MHSGSYPYVVSKASEWLIVVGSCVFISMLALSAYWEPDIRWLHFLQAWMYVAAIVLSHRSLRDAGRLLVSFALTTGFFALDMALFQPRYLGLFPRMLHPRLP